MKQSPEIVERHFDSTGHLIVSDNFTMTIFGSCAEAYIDESLNLTLTDVIVVTDDYTMDQTFSFVEDAELGYNILCNGEECGGYTSELHNLVLYENNVTIAYYFESKNEYPIVIYNEFNPVPENGTHNMIAETNNGMMYLYQFEPNTVIITFDYESLEMIITTIIVN